MSTLCLMALTTAEGQTEGFWQFLLHHPVVIVGVLAALSGILMGNMGVWKMMDDPEANLPAQPEMFSTGEVTSPVSPQASREAAIAKYQEANPDGPFYKMLERGQVLTVVGCLITLIGMFF